MQTPLVVEKPQDIDLGNKNDDDDKKSTQRKGTPPGDKKPEPAAESAEKLKQPAAAKSKAESRAGSSASSKKSAAVSDRRDKSALWEAKIPDYSKLHMDFDRRLNALEVVDNDAAAQILTLERSRHLHD